MKFISLPPDKKSDLTAIIVFALIAVVPFLWPCAGAWNNVGAGDYLAPLDAFISLQDIRYTFNHLVSGGIDESFQIALLPVYAFFYLAGVSGFSPLGSTLLFISLVIFVTQVSFFYFIRYAAVTRLGAARPPGLSLAPWAIAYGVSPFVAAQIVPGHFYALLVYAFFPAIIGRLDSLMLSPALGRKELLTLFLISLACSAGFANIGIIYVLLIACSIYCLVFLFFQQANLFRVFSRFCIFASLVLLANAWWLFPQIANLRSYIAVSQSSATSITSSLAYASAFDTLLNIFLGKPQGIFYMPEIVGDSHYVSRPAVGAFLGILAFFLAGLFLRRRYLYLLSAAMVASVFFMKGVQPPFSDLFLWAYKNVPGFQILRRPDAKFYGFFLFYYWAAAAGAYTLVSVDYITTRSARKWLQGLAWGTSALLVFIFAKTGGLIPFNIPPEYTLLSAQMEKETPSRVLVLPGTLGLNPVYTAAVNSYNAPDFMNELLRFPKVFPDSTSNSNNQPSKALANSLARAVREGTALRAPAKVLGVSHILVRQDLDRGQEVEDNPFLLRQKLDRHPDVKKVFSTGEGEKLAVYRLKDMPSSGLLYAEADSGPAPSFSYDVLSPVEILLHLHDLKQSASLNLLTNFNRKWQIYPAGNTTRKDILNSSFARPKQGYEGGSGTGFRGLKYLTAKPVFEKSHTITKGYANGWRISSEDIIAELPPGGYRLNPDGSVSASFVLFYRNQSYAVAGFIATLLSFAALLILFIYEAARKNPSARI